MDDALSRRNSQVIFALNVDRKDFFATDSLYLEIYGYYFISYQMNWHPDILDMQQLLNFSQPPCTQGEKNIWKGLGLNQGPL